MQKVLLFNPPSALDVYKRSKIRAVVPRLPNMALAMIAGSLIEERVSVKIVDLMLYPNNEAEDITYKEITEFGPDIVGVTATTPLFYEAVKISDKAKSVSKDIVTILGGAHASSLPEECLGESSFDIVVVGEGEKRIKDIIKGNISKDSVVYCDNIPIEELPLPALELFDSRNYVCSRVIARNNPVGPIEMSRGCVFNCSYCNKTVHGRKFRVKEPDRIIEELKRLKKLGYREFHVLDDQFTTNIKKAKEICEEIIKSGINMTWNLRTGVRVDRVDKEFLSLAKRSGCYQMGVGFESGSQSCLDAIDKGIKTEQALRAAEMIRKMGIEIAGFFMIGLPEETIESMEETIRFAIRLNPDYAKATILVPFPGTRIYNEFDQKGWIKTKDWSKYNFHSASRTFTHPTLSWECLESYYEIFHRRFYFRLNYLTRRFWNSLLQGRIFSDLYHGYQTFSKNP